MGQLSWIAGISQPYISFIVFEFSTNFTQASVAYIPHVNKITRNTKKTKHSIRYPRYPDIDTHLHMY